MKRKLWTLITWKFSVLPSSHELFAPGNQGNENPDQLLFIDRRHHHPQWELLKISLVCWLDSPTRNGRKQFVSCTFSCTIHFLLCAFSGACCYISSGAAEDVPAPLDAGSSVHFAQERTDSFHNIWLEILKIYSWQCYQSSHEACINSGNALCRLELGERTVKSDLLTWDFILLTMKKSFCCVSWILSTLVCYTRILMIIVSETIFDIPQGA